MQLGLLVKQGKKGSDLIIKAIKILKNNGVNIEFKLFIGKPNDLVLNAIANSDIHIDQIGVGWYGTISAEVWQWELQ